MSGRFPLPVYPMLDSTCNPLDPGDLLSRGRRPIYLIRHGQTAWNVQRRFLGKSNIPLDEVGKSQACALAERVAFLPMSTIYSSPLSRARETAETIAKGREQCLVKMVQDLAELDQGELEGKKGECLPRDYPEFFTEWVQDPTDVRVPGGETMAECQSRSWAALHRILEDADPELPVVLVSHKMVICSILCRMLELPIKHFRTIGQGNTAINLLSHGPEGLQLHRLNDIEHLAISP
jgi:broad specificity phosphatase PhoE